MHDLITAREAISLAFGLWLFFTGGVLPRFILNPRVLGLVSLLVGVVLGYFDSTVPPRPPWWISLDTLFVILATGVALAHSEIIFRRANGYWRLVGRRTA